MLIPHHENYQYIIVSSSCFIAAGCYGCYLKLYWIGAYNCFTGLVSMNHWRMPMYGIRRTIDIYNARVYFCIYVYLVFTYINDTKLKIISYLLMLNSLMLFHMSDMFREPEIKYKYWYRYHFMFHIALNTTASIIFYLIY
jgi:hypothetical protein